MANVLVSFTFHDDYGFKLSRNFFTFMKRIHTSSFKVAFEY